MTDVAALVVDNLAIWTGATERRSGAGRGGGKRLNLYGIERLRALILDLAVRGRLVPQDSQDEPASEFLKRISKEKARLLKAAEIKKEKPLDPITVENQPFNLPQNWSWVRLDSLSRLITKGSEPLRVCRRLQLPNRMEPL